LLAGRDDVLAALRRLAPGVLSEPVLTEFGYQSAGRYKMTQAKRRVWALKAMQLVARFKVKEMLWYQLVHNPNTFGDIWDSGLVSMKGVPDLTYLNLQRNRRSYAGF